jgi:uncharacterized protein (DUF58 family)
MRPWQYIGLVLVTGALAVVTGWQPLWAITYALGLAFVLSVVWLILSTRGLAFSRSAFGGRAQVGQRIEERLELENHTALPKLWVQVSDSSTLPGHHAGYVASIGPHQRITWRAKTVCRRRGRFTLGPVTATTGDPLGLFRREMVLAPEQGVLVLPTVLPLATLSLYPGVIPGHGRGSQRSLQVTTNVVTVRNYVPGDALARIHWPSTARLGQFMVKEFDLDPTIDVVILLDLNRGAQAGENESSTEEYGVTIAASIASYLLRQQELAVGLTASGSREPPLPLDRGERQLDRILEMLAVSRAERAVSVEEALVIEEARLVRNTVLILITPATDLDWPHGLSHLQHRGVRPYVILLDPQSFDEQRFGTARAYDALVALGVPVVGIKRGDPLVHILEQGAGL